MEISVVQVIILGGMGGFGLGIAFAYCGMQWFAMRDK